MYKVDNIIFYASAIRFFDRTENSYVELYGERHSDIFQLARACGYNRRDISSTNEQGFLIGLNGLMPMFYSREEATKLAKEHNLHMSSEILTSEDLW